MNKAIFLDRDGTINVDYGYVYKIDDFTFIEGVIEACRELKQLGYLLVIITNQSGIGRGMYSEQQFLQLSEWLDWNFIDKGVELDGIYYCPHYKDGIEPYNIECNCRKPKIGLIEEATKELNIDLSQSIIVGDSLADIKAGKNAKLKASILVKTGKEQNLEAQKLADYCIESVKFLPQLLKSL